MKKSKVLFGDDINNRFAMAVPVALVSSLMLVHLLAVPVYALLSGAAGAAVASVAAWVLQTTPLIVVSLLWYAAAKELSLMACVAGRWTAKLLIQALIMTVGLCSLVVIAYATWQWFVILLVGTYAIDSLAYGTGRAFARLSGKPTHKLPFGLDRMSPNKTIEGFIGGAVVGWIVAGLLAWLFVATAGLVLGWYGVLVIAMMPFTAFVGDVFESQVKRDVGVKDAGDCLGAHGGVMDRLDSVAAVYVSATPLLFI